MRRGIESTSIYSIDFDYFDGWLAVICKTDTVHVWKLNIGEQKKKDQSKVRWLTNWIPGMEDKTQVKIKLGGIKNPFLYFDHQAKLWVVSQNGNYKKIDFDFENVKLKVIEDKSLYN